MAKRHGKNGRVIMGGGVLSAVTWNLDMSTDKVDVSGFGDANKIYVVGKKDLQGSLSGFWDDANDALFDAADASGLGTTTTMFLYPDHANAPSQYWTGAALVDASINTDSNGAVAFNGTFVAAGNWTRQGVA
jgi:hypothetical protein